MSLFFMHDVFPSFAKINPRKVMSIDFLIYYDEDETPTHRNTWFWDQAVYVLSYGDPI